MVCEPTQRHSGVRKQPIYGNKIKVVKNYNLGFKMAPEACRLGRTFQLRRRSHVLTLRINPKPVNNMFISFFPAVNWLFTVSESAYKPFAKNVPSLKIIESPRSVGMIRTSGNRVKQISVNVIKRFKMTAHAACCVAEELNSGLTVA